MVLAILKGIGILLLILLGLLVFICAAVLFVPVRYSVKFTADGSYTFGFSASWFLRAVRLRKGSTESDVHILLFGIDVSGLKKKRKASTRMKKSSSRVEVTSDYDGSAEDSQESGRIRRAVHTEKSGKTSKIGKQTKNKSSGKSSGKQTENRSSGKKVFGRAKKSFSFDGISSIITFIRGGENKAGIQKIKKEIFGLFCYLKPSQVKGSLIFGTGDPCTTGWILGIISLIPAAYAKGIRVIPDFEQKELDADLFAKGKVHVFYFLRMILRGYMDKDMKAVITKAIEYV